MSRSRFPWRLLFFLILSACAGFIAYDVYTNKGFQSKYNTSVPITVAAHIKPLRIMH
jgi:hypothetical protein